MNRRGNEGRGRSFGERLGHWAARVRERPRTVMLAGLVALGLASCSTGAAVAAWTHACGGRCPTAAQIEDFAPQQATELYDNEGGLLGLFYRERRQLVPVERLPEHVTMAFVAIEDRRFFEHTGVDVWRVLGAVRDNVFGGFGASGASTISMQLARNLFPEQLPPSEKSLRRKIAEARLALAMERRLTKDEILELYLNHIYLGAGAYGVEAAARTYFDVPAAELSVAQAAMLAGLPQAPSRYDPRRNPSAALGRRNIVLDYMADMGVIEDEAAERLADEPLGLAPPSGVMHAPYFVEHLRRQLEERFGELLYTGGLKIYTTIDPQVQLAAETALEEHLAEIESGTYGWFPYPSYEEFVAQRTEAGGEAVQTPYLQGVVVAMDPRTGDVLAMVGGRDFRHSQFNRATQALRQPGSAFKPFVYAAGLESGRSPLYQLSDGPIYVPQADGSTWIPRNYSGEYGGDMTLRQGLRESRNMVAIRLGAEVGPEAVQSVAHRAGIRTPIPEYPSTYIGAAAVYPLDLISAYAAFANGGMRVDPHFIRRIEDREGRVLWEPERVTEPVFAPAVSWILTDMLREVVDRGTGYGVRNPAVGNIPYDVPAAGKTGTTNDNTDVWFVGYTPEILAGVWIGLDQPQTITSGATGGGFAVPVWARVVRTFYENREPPPAWERPSDVLVRKISRWTGMAVTDDCPYVVGAFTDYFVGSAAPEPGCEPPSLDVDPTPHLPGRPVFPGRPMIPQPGDFLDTVPRTGGDGAGR